MTIGSDDLIFSADHSTHLLSLDGTGTNVPLYHPSNRIDFAAFGREVTWTIRPLRIVADAAPTSWSLGVKFAEGIDHTDGPQFANPKFVDFDALRTETDIAEGIGWAKRGLTANDASVPAHAGLFGVIADQTSGLGDSVSRTVRLRTNRHRIYLEPKVTGGSNVKLALSIVATVRR